MNNQITFNQINPFTVIVRLGNKRTGQIKHEPDGWRYYPNGQKKGGDAFDTLPACKKSLLS